MKRLLILAALFLLVLSPFAFGQDEDEDDTYAETIADLERIEGFIPLYYDPDTDNLFLEITRLNIEC